MGSFVVTVDDGSGYPSASLLTTIGGAVEAVRPVGSIFTVQPPAVLTANVSMTITVAAGATKAAIIALTGPAIQDYVNGLTIGTPLPLTKLAQLAYQASPAVTNVSAITINGFGQDLFPSVASVIKAGTVAVN